MRLTWSNKLITKFLVSLVLVSVSFRFFNYQEAIEIISKAELDLIFVATALVLLHFVFVCIRWAIVISGFGYKVSLFQLLKIVLVGQFIKQIFPSQILSELVKIVLCTKIGIEVSTGTLSFLIDKLLGLLTLFLLVLLTKYIFSVETIYISIPQISTTALAIFILLSVLILGLLAFFAWLKVVRFSAKSNALDDFTKTFYKILQNFSLSHMLTLKVIVVSMFSNLLIVLSVYVISIALDAQIQLI